MKTLRTAGMVVAAVALVATGVGALAGAGVLGAAAMGSAGVVAGISTATITAVGMYAGLAAGVIGLIGAAAAPKVSNQGSATSFTTNPQSGLPYAIGRTRMSGLRYFADTNTRPGYTKFNDLLWFGALLTIGGQIEGIEKFTGDNEAVTFAADGNAIGTYHDYQAQKVHTGGPMASALAVSLGGGTAPGWTSAHKLSGIAHAMWCLRYNKQGEMYGAGAPEPAWIGKWVKVYDPRLDSTYPGGSGNCRALDETTYVWSDNPGLHALTWSLGRWQNGKRTCGIGAPIANIRVEEFVECANVCDANAWKVGGVEWTTDSKWDTLKRILQAGGAVPTQTGAMIGCMVYMPRVAIATIESWHLHDGCSFPMTKSRRDRFNTVIPRYVDEASEWSVISGTAITEPVFAAADRGLRTKEIDFPLVQVFEGEEAKQPGQLAAYEIVNSREAGPWTITTGPQWIGLKTGDVVNLNVPGEGIVNQPVLITRRSIDPASGKVSFTVQTETPSKHAYALGQSTTPPAPFSLSAPDLKPPAPTEAEWTVTGATSGEGFPALLVAGDSAMPSADAIVIDYRLHAANESAGAAWTNSAILSAVDTVRHVIAPLESQTAYDVRISYRVGTIDGDATIFEQVITGAGKITTIESQLQDQDAALAELDADVAQAEVDIATALAAAAQAQADADQAKGDVLAAQQEIEQQGAALTAAESAIQQQAADILAAKGDILANATSIQTVSDTVSSQGSSITTLQQAVTANTGSIATLSITVSAHTASISQNSQAISTAQGDLASLSATVSSQGASISTLQTASTSQAGSIATLQQQVVAGNPNMLRNPGLTEGTSFWYYNGKITPSSTMAVATDNVWGTYATIQGISGGVPGYGYVDSEPVGAYGNVAYACTCNAEIHGNPAATVGIEMLYIGTNGVEISRTYGPKVTAATFANSSNVRPALAARGIAPPGTAKILIRIVFDGNGGNVILFGFTQVKLEASANPTQFSDEISVRTQYQAISANGTSIASLTQTVSTQGGQISSNATAITALQGTVTSLSTTVSTQGASITSLQTASTNQAGDIATLKLRIVAGGGNLLNNTEFSSGLAGWTYGSNSQTGISFGINLAGPAYQVPGTNAATIVQSNGNAGGYSEMTQDFPGQSGELYDISVWYGAHRCNVSFYLLAFDAAGNTLGQLGSLVNLAEVTTNTASLSGWSRVSFKSGVAPANTSFLRLYMRKGPTWTSLANSYAWFLRPQAIKTKSDAPSPQDYSAGIERASIEFQASAISTINTQVSTLQTTVSTQGSSITANATAITTLQTQTATLTTKVTAGNPNLIPNGSGEFLLDYWSIGYGSWAVGQEGIWGSYFYVNNNGPTGEKYYHMRANTVAFSPGYTATASCDIDFYTTNPASSYFVLEVRFLDSSFNILSAYNSATVAAPRAFGQAEQNRELTKVTTPQAPAGTAWAQVTPVFYTANGVSLNGAAVRRIKLEVGSLATPYASDASVMQTYSAIRTTNSQVASLSSTVSTQGVTITSQQTAITTINGNITSLMGRWGFEIDANGYVSGLIMNNNGQRADLTVRGDRFRVVPPGGAGTEGWTVDVDGSGRTTQYILAGGVRVWEAGWLN